MDQDMSGVLDDDTTRKIIHLLLEEGLKRAREWNKCGAIWVQERTIASAVSFLNAAEAVLHDNAHLHNELVECPEFMELRKFRREHY